MRRVLLWAAVFTLSMWLAGCSLAANPKTELSYNPITRTVAFSDTKDNDIEITDLEIDPDTKSFHLGKLILRNNASDVRRANVEQINAITEQVKAVTAMVNLATQAWSGVVSGAIPYALPGVRGSLTTPYGGGTFETSPVLPSTTQPVTPNAP